jgi:hypothetical protein
MIPTRKGSRRFESHSLRHAVIKYSDSRENELKTRFFGPILADTPSPYRFSRPFLRVNSEHSLKFSAQGLRCPFKGPESSNRLRPATQSSRIQIVERIGRKCCFSAQFWRICPGCIDSPDLSERSDVQARHAVVHRVEQVEHLMFRLFFVVLAVHLEQAPADRHDLAGYVVHRSEHEAFVVRESAGGCRALAIAAR